MTSKRLLDKNPASVRGTGAGTILYGGNYCTKHNEQFSLKTGVITKKKSTVNGFDTQTVDTRCLREPSKELSPNGKQLASGREKHYTKKKVSEIPYHDTCPTVSVVYTLYYVVQVNFT